MTGVQTCALPIFNQAVRIADHGYIIVHGEIVFKGDVDAIKNNEMVKNFYLGVAT